MYKIILFIYLLNTSFQTWATPEISKDSIHEWLQSPSFQTWAIPPNSQPPQTIQKAMREVVSVQSPRGEGSGFIIRDNKGKAILVTAYHVIRGLLNDFSQIHVFAKSSKKLKIKKLLSYSKMIDVVFFGARKL